MHVETRSWVGLRIFVTLLSWNRFCLPLLFLNLHLLLPTPFLVPARPTGLSIGDIPGWSQYFPQQWTRGDVEAQCGYVEYCGTMSVVTEGCHSEGLPKGS